MKILLDTNFLIDMMRFKVDLNELDELIDSEYSLAVITPVLQELRTISNRKTKESMYAKVALKLIEVENLEIIKSGKRTDEELVNLSHGKTIVATNDGGLRKELKALGKKSIYLKSKKHLAIG